MSVYLHDIPLPQAQARLDQALIQAGLAGILGQEEVSLDEKALGRVLSAAVWAKISSPHYHAAAMDGFAVRAEHTSGATPTEPVQLVCSDQAVYVDTGDPLPGWANAVIPIENTEAVNAAGELHSDLRHPDAIRIREALPPWQHVRPLGEDIVATELVLPAGHTLRPVDLGAIAACGHDRVVVARRPRVAILPTGSELVPPGQPVKPGDIIEYNSLVLSAQVHSWGGEADRFPITRDNFDEIKTQVALAARSHDLVLLNAGSSAGAEDFSARVVESLGELLVHGVAVRPGHPVILGMLRREAGHDLAEIPGKIAQGWIPIIGVPGYPVSAAITGEIFVKPMIERWLGKQATRLPQIQATLTRKVTSPAGDDDYMRVAVGRVGDKMLAAPLSRGAGVITSLVRADGLAVLPRGTQGLPAGAQVVVQLYRTPQELENTIFAIGSHDICLDLLAQFLSARHRRLVSANVGSQGGMIALRRGEAHLAGSHLLDPETGEYNLTYIRQYLPGFSVKVIALVGRQQGLMLLPGNPKNILSLQDLHRADVTYINRQRGAGTRVLLDYYLGQLGLDSEQIHGYDQEEYTHLAVAAAVRSGRADCGLGIAAAAKALELDFIPLYQERYDLLVPEEYYSGDLLAPLWDILNDRIFRQAVSTLPGYDTGPMGTLVASIDG
jgi:putative molybdopterin biosynthesis protein